MGANEITRATPACYFIALGEIFLEYSWNILKKSLNLKNHTILLGSC